MINRTKPAPQNCPADLDPGIFEIFLAVGASPISDALDAMGHHDRALAPGFVPISEDMVVVGRVRTLSSAPHTGPVSEGQEYELLIQAIDGLGSGDVLVTDRTDCCVWGELCSERALHRGSNGAVIDGYHRDARLVLATGFAVVSRGTHVTDMLYKRRIVACDQPVECGGVQVSPGDIIVADLDGAVVIPARIVEEVAAHARAKASAETEVRAALKAGASVRDVWDKYKVL